MKDILFLELILLFFLSESSPLQSTNVSPIVNVYNETHIEIDFYKSFSVIKPDYFADVSLACRPIFESENLESMKIVRNEIENVKGKYVAPVNICEIQIMQVRIRSVPSLNVIFDATANIKEVIEEEACRNGSDLKIELENLRRKDFAAKKCMESIELAKKVDGKLTTIYQENHLFKLDVDITPVKIIVSLRNNRSKSFMLNLEKLEECAWEGTFV